MPSRYYVRRAANTNGHLTAYYIIKRVRARCSTPLLRLRHKGLPPGHTQPPHPSQESVGRTPSPHSPRPWWRADVPNGTSSGRAGRALGEHVARPHPKEGGGHLPGGCVHKPSGRKGNIIFCPSVENCPSPPEGQRANEGHRSQGAVATARRREPSQRADTRLKRDH